METNTERLALNVLGDIRENLGIDADDSSMDERINKMDNDELFRRWCTWNGLPEWDGPIKGALRNIYGIKFGE